MSRASLPPLAGAVLALSGGLLAGLPVSAGTLDPRPLSVAAALVALGLLVPPTRVLRPGEPGGGRARASREPGGVRARASRADRSVVLALWGVAGVLLGQAAAREARTDCRTLLPDGARLELTGVLEARPEPDGAAFLRATAVRGEGEWWPCEGTVRVRLPRGRRGSVVAAGGEGERPASPGVRDDRLPDGAPAPLRGGTSLSVRGRWWALLPEGPWPRRPERAGVLLAERLGEPAARPQAGRRPDAFPEGIVFDLRDAAQRRLRRLFGQEAPVVEALLLARKEGLDPDLRDRFARAGLSHLLAISGLHVGVIAGVLLLLGRLLRLRHGAASAAAAGATVLYVAFLGFPHAAARAALQAVLFLGARALQRPTHPASVLAAAALLLLAADPLALLDPGFQLSFAGVAGLLALLGPVTARLAWLPGRPLREASAASVAATLATAPVVAWHFAQAAPIGVLANLPAIPIASLAVPAAALTLLVDTGSHAGGQFLADGARALIAALDAVARAAVEVPFGHRAVARPELQGWAAAVLAGSLCARGLRRTGSPRRASAGGPPGAAGGIRSAVRGVVVGGVMAGTLLGWAPLAERVGGGGSLEIHAIDVGQGDAIAIRTPAGRWILVDAGPRSASYDAGRSRVVPYLLRRGVRRLEALVLTHPDADHIGGAAAVLEVTPARTVLDPALAAGKELYLDVLERARLDRSRWVAGREGATLALDGVRIVVLAPTDSAVAAGAPANDASVVFRLEFGAFSALFQGDAPAEVERHLARRLGAGLRADLLKVGHHGSITSTSDELLGAARPELALIPVGRGNRYGHPHPLVLERLEAHGVRVLRTDRHGAITIRVTRSGAVRVEMTR